MKQLDLFTWADSKPSNVIDAMPALIKRAAMEAAYQFPKPKGQGQIIEIGRDAA